MNWINPMTLVINEMNPVNLIYLIICLCQLYSEDEQRTYNILDFVYKIKNIIIYMSEIQFLNSSKYWIKILNLSILYSQVSN